MLGAFLESVLLFVGFLFLFSAYWANNTFGNIDMKSIIFTLSTPLESTSDELINSFLLKSLLPALLIGIAVFFLIFYLHKQKHRFKPIFSILLCVILSICMIGYSLNQVGFIEYLNVINHNSSFFEENYVDPETVSITFPTEKKNLIYIYAESFETTYLSKEQGGAMDINLTDDIALLAEDNLNFSNTDLLGGFQKAAATGWTTAAIVSSTAGIPLDNPYDTSEERTSDISFLPGAYSLGEILEKEGYENEFYIDSKKEFGSRDLYLEQHGNYKIFDYTSAVETEKTPEGYDVWWGYEDEKLFTYAKDELLHLADEEQPFNFTMLTTDTHHPNGFIEDSCIIKHNDNFEAAITCSSNQIVEFIHWIQNRDFYEDTVIVVSGDHLSMNKTLFENIDPDYTRTVLNFFINTKTIPLNGTKNRQYTSYDMYPTVLAAIGAEIDGDRLGLGTNLFSKEQTLPELFGLEFMNDELDCNSNYYNQHIIYDD